MTAASTELELADLEIDLFLEAIFRRYKHDFRHYARPTLHRRLKQAMTHVGAQSLSLLQHQVLRDAKVCGDVLRYLSVPVSDLFRDPRFFKAVREKVVPVLRTWPSFKVWVAGCSTGEEVYSLAILFEEVGLLNKAILYATDVSTEALRAAEQGVYDIARVAGFSANYTKAGGTRSLSDYYTAAYGAVAFDKRLRQNVVFSDHSLSTDSVFAEVQLVTCRNVLIYFDDTLRDRALGLFKDSLPRHGVLALGMKESLRSSLHTPSFSELDREHRIYERR